MVVCQMHFRITNANEAEMMAAAVFIKDNYSPEIHSVSGNSDNFEMAGNILPANYVALVAAIQAFKSEFTTRLWWSFTLEKD